MPSGLKILQEMFQMKIQMIMEKFPGIIAIHDNVAVYAGMRRTMMPVS